MISTQELPGLAGKHLAGVDGHKIGKIVDVYESTDGSDGTFVTVHTGLFGGHASFVPLREAALRDGEVVVPYHKDQVKDAPRVAADEELTSQEEQRLYQHYQLGADDSRPATGGPETGTPVPRGTDGRDVDGDGVYDDVQDTAVGRDTSGLTTDDAMTRSEERLNVGTEKVQTGVARLRKRIVTENVTTTVPVSREEVFVERESITDANRGKAMDGPELSEEEHEVVLTEERPVVNKETVPVERVRLGTNTVTEQAEVNETVRKESIDMDGGKDIPQR